VQSVDPGLPQATDLLGRRIFGGLLTSALLLSGAWLLATDHWLFGGGLWIGCAAWLSWHSLREVQRALGRRSRRGQ
jgi:hypothetical protein